MKLLSTPEAISAEFKRLIKAYTHLDWAVAWASTKFSAFDLLRRHRHKIRHIVVGTEFHQTHPDFIAEFANQPTVRFRLDDEGLNGVFHPKVYLFSDSDTSWEAVVGSPNFTKAAFTGNVECAVLLNPQDAPSTPLYIDLLQQVKLLWKSGSQIDQQKLAAYRIRWQANKRRLLAAKGFSSKKLRTKSIYDCPILNMDWPHYFQHVQDDGNFFQGRLDMLHETSAIFDQRHSLTAMTLEERKRICGTAAEGTIKWRLFGSMVGNPHFKQRINTNDPRVSDALDRIPAAGPVAEGHFDDYVAGIRKAFVYHKPFGGLAIATRLPCIKRPDYFLCIDGKNTAGLYDGLGLRRRKVTLDNYWATVVQPLIDSPWWRSNPPAQPEELAVWKTRVAMLDALYYDP